MIPSPGSFIPDDSAADEAVHSYSGPGTHVPYSGEAPFGSCQLQCVANLLAWQGVSAADEGLCPTWGFSWPGGTVLKGSGRWPGVIRAAYEIDLEERCFSGFPEACHAEADSVRRGYPVASTVDAWHVPSPFTGIEHIAHCVLVVASTADHVWIVDPMNRPSPVRYARADWQRMRSAACVPGFRTFLVSSGPRRRPASADLIRWLRRDIQAGQAGDRRQLEAFLACCRGDGHPPDVSEVAAERLYLAKLVRRAARTMPALARLADELVSLTRRWYLAHTLARESATDPRQLARQVCLLEDLAERERVAVDYATTCLETASVLENEDG